MWRKLIPFVFILSIVINLVCLVFIGAKAFNQSADSEASSQTATCSRACSLHKSIGADISSCQAIEPLQEKFGLERCRICREIDTANQELINAIAASEPDHALIQTIKDQIIDYQRQMQDLVVDQIIREKELLPEELQKKFIGAFRRECGSSVGTVAAKGVTGKSCQNK